MKTKFLSKGENKSENDIITKNKKLRVCNRIIHTSYLYNALINK